MHTVATSLREGACHHIALLLATLLSVPVIARETQGGSSVRSLADLSIEELMNEPVTSVSRRAEPLGDAAAAIAVLTHDDLVRSGATSIVDALRLVPGVDVGTQTASQSAVSARGFNHLYSNKLLVLVDGRAVYNPLFAGVFWDLQQPLLDDVERIEVIRGPGATLWGANAVNGVINIITFSARDTHGGLWYAGGGNVEKYMVGARYGGELSSSTDYRVFATTQSTADFRTHDGLRAGDGWRGWSAGARVDSDAYGGAHLTWQADASGVDLDHGVSDGYNVNTLARWSRTLSERSSLEVQAYYDRTYRNESARALSATDTLDLSLQQAVALGARNQATWGMGYRLSAGRAAETTPLITVVNRRFTMGLFSFFLQDEISVVPDRVFVAAGTKLEHNDFTGLEVQPSLRVRIKPSARHSVWAAVSRAVRTPDAVEGKNVFAIPVAAPVTGPDGGLYVPTLVGDARPVSEVLHAHELGYRVQVGAQASIDVAAFYNEYRNLIDFGPVRRFVPGVPVGVAALPLTNLGAGETHGGEIGVTFAPAAAWRWSATYSLLRGNIRGPAAGFNIGGPQQQASLRSFHDFSARASLTSQLRYVDTMPGVPSYITADVHVTYHLTEAAEFALTGQNLLERQHAEQGSALLEPTAEVPRSFYIRFTKRL